MIPSAEENHTMESPLQLWILIWQRQIVNARA
jgi:hypothetical protein